MVRVLSRDGLLVFSFVFPTKAFSNPRNFPRFPWLLGSTYPFFVPTSVALSSPSLRPREFSVFFFFDRDFASLCLFSATAAGPRLSSLFPPHSSARRGWIFFKHVGCTPVFRCSQAWSSRIPPPPLAPLFFGPRFVRISLHPQGALVAVRSPFLDFDVRYTSASHPMFNSSFFPPRLRVSPLNVFEGLATLSQFPVLSRRRPFPLGPSFPVALT